MGLKDLLGKMKGKAANRVFVNRAPRVRINYLHDLEFVAREPKFDAALKIENISSSGLGLILPPETDFASLVAIDGDLNIGTTSYALKLKVVRFNGEHVGLVIETPSAEYVQGLQKYFETEIAALSLNPTRADYLKPVANGTPHWYQGSNNCDLSYVSSGNDVVEFALSVFGNHIEGGMSRPLRYSEISEKPPGETAGHKGSDLLNVKRAPDAEILRLAKRVVNAIEKLPADHRASLLNYLS